MKVSLPLNDFAFVKVAIGFCVLVTALLFPLVSVIALIVLVAGRAHTLGAWIAMWRAGKFTWPFIVWTIGMMAALSYWIFVLADLQTIALVGFSIFIFHFVYDEFELQRERHTWTNGLLGASPFIIAILYLFSDTFRLGIEPGTLLAIGVSFVLVQLLHMREITWFFVRTNMLAFFVVLCAYLHITAVTAILVFLIDHYAFWFIYPIYRLHKFNRAERDGFIMILLVIVGLSVFIMPNSSPWDGSIAHIDFTSLKYVFALKVFFLGSMAHILTTAPFTYLFGIGGKPRPHAPAPVNP